MKVFLSILFAGGLIVFFVMETVKLVGSIRSLRLAKKVKQSDVASKLADIVQQQLDENKQTAANNSTAD